MNPFIYKGGRDLDFYVFLTPESKCTIPLRVKKDLRGFGEKHKIDWWFCFVCFIISAEVFWILSLIIQEVIR